jgi:hypothetical protein
MLGVVINKIRASAGNYYKYGYYGASNEQQAVVENTEASVSSLRRRQYGPGSTPVEEATADSTLPGIQSPDSPIQDLANAQLPKRVSGSQAQGRQDLG